MLVIATALICVAGVLLERYGLSTDLTSRERQADSNSDGFPDYVNLINSDNRYTIFQPYVQGQIRITEALTLNAGLHGQYFSLNSVFETEPRASLTWKLELKHFDGETS